MKKLSRTCPKCCKIYVNYVRTGDTIYCPHCTMAIKYRPLPDEIKIGTPEAIRLGETMYAIGMAANMLESLIVKVNDIIDVSGEYHAQEAIEKCRVLVRMYDDNLADTTKLGDDADRFEKIIMKEVLKFAKKNTKWQTTWQLQ